SSDRHGLPFPRAARARGPPRRMGSVRPRPRPAGGPVPEGGVPMSAPATPEEVLALVRRSGLIAPDRLDAYMGELAAVGPLRGDPRQLVGLMVRDSLLTFFQAEQILQGKWRGYTLGKYRLLERIGVGGMGQVFLCEHQFMRRRVAVKVLPPLKAKDPAA